MPPEYCPNCGEEVPDQARACPACGSCEETGWSSSAHAERLGVPDDSFDYDRFVQEEFGGGSHRPPNRRRVWWVAACVVLAVFLALILFH